MKIIESFISIQGEGLRTGRPSMFVRLNGCNLRCVFRNPEGKVASICDTSYASFGNTENKIIDEDEVLSMFVNNPTVGDVVITGGEPLLDQKGLYEFIMKLREIRRDFALTIETNGTITPDENLLEQVDLWSCSPKLSTSTPTIKDCKKYGITEANCKYHENARINLVALSTIIEKGHDAQLKFVYTGPECINEIEGIKNAIQKMINLDNVDEYINNYIMLMPEGITKTAILGKSDEVVKVCIEKGWTYSTRMHILIWGNVKEK